MSFNSPDACWRREIAGVGDVSEPAAVEAHSILLPEPGQAVLMTTGLLLVPDSTNDRVMALDPITGNVVDANFVPSNNVVWYRRSTPSSAPPGDSILVSDQTGDVVHEFDLDGNYLGIFAPAGGVNNAILNNIRGIALDANGNLLGNRRRRRQHRLRSPSSTPAATIWATSSPAASAG